MTITHEPAHFRKQPEEPPRVDVYLPRRDIRVDTTFWQHRSMFAGSQEQLDELRREADERAAARARAAFADHVRAERTQPPSVYELHRPAFRRLKAIVHVGLVPMLWSITTCKCGDRWPCNDITQYFRSRLGWTADITGHLKALTKRLPKPATRLSRLRRLLTRRRATTDGPAAGRGHGADRRHAYRYPRPTPPPR